MPAGSEIIEYVGLVCDLNGVVCSRCGHLQAPEVLLAPEVENPRGKVYSPQNPQAFAAFARTALSLRSSGVSAASALLRARSYRTLRARAPAKASTTDKPISPYHRYPESMRATQVRGLPGHQA